jgi:CIC family chloride channel protein
LKDIKELAHSNFYKFSFAIIATGIISGLSVFSLHYLEQKITFLLGTDKSFTWKTYLFSFLLTSISLYLTKNIFTQTGGSGIPHVKLSLVALKGRMKKRMFLGKMTTSLLSLSSGLTLGKEGPMVTISSAFGFLMGHALKLETKLVKILVTSGASAGLAAAFHTPIAAVVFTIEEILGEFNVKYLGPVVFTSVIASITSYKLSANHATFSQLEYTFSHEWHLILYLLLGFFMAILGRFWIRLVLFFKGVKQNYFSNLEYVFLFLVVSITTLASIYSHETLGDGITTINRLLLQQGDISIKILLILLILKIFLSATAYSTGLSGGLFMPVLFLGAAGGALCGSLFISLGIPHVKIGIFAFLGMTSALVAVINAPLTAFVMLFEMTRDYELILPLMISSISAYWLSNLISQESVYEAVAEFEGEHLPTPKDNEGLEEMIVEECMNKNVFFLNYNINIKKAWELIQAKDFSEYPVMKNNKLAGFVKKEEIENAVKTKAEDPLNNIIHEFFVIIYSDQTLLMALNKIKRFQLNYLYVVSRFQMGRVIGVITSEDILKYFNLIENQTKEV